MHATMHVTMYAKYIANLDSETLLNPAADIWKSVAAKQVSMSGTPAAMQPTAAIRESWSDKSIGAVKEVQIKAVHNGAVLAFQLSWSAPQYSENHGDNTQFPDGAAIAFPLRSGAPVLSMGTPDLPVSLWHWQATAEGTGKQLVAGGIGSSEIVDKSRVRTSAQWKEGFWQVVIMRELEVIQGDAVAQFKPGNTVEFALAVWNGNSKERGGIKSFSGNEWLNLTLAQRTVS